MPDEVRYDPPPERGDVHVYNQPSPRSDGGGPGLVIGLVVVVLLIAALWFAFGRGGSVVPEEIDVDINLPTTPDPTPQPAPQPPPSEPVPQPTPPPAPPPNPGG